MAVYKRGNVWWYRFTWNGKAIRESTKQTNKRVAEQIEAAHKTSLAKGEVGIRQKKRTPTVAEFAEKDFLPHVRSRFADKRSTLAYYGIQVGHLIAYPPLATAPIDSVTPDIISGFVDKCRAAEYEVSSINRALQVLRRMRRLAVEWGRVEKAMVPISLLPGERRRERVLSPAEENTYLEAARTIGEKILEAYTRAKKGIRATQRGQRPNEPEDPFRMRDVASVLLDCGLRPEECQSRTWKNSPLAGRTWVWIASASTYICPLRIAWIPWSACASAATPAKWCFRTMPHASTTGFRDGPRRCCPTGTSSTSIRTFCLPCAPAA